MLVAIIANRSLTTSSEPDCCEWLISGGSERTKSAVS